MLTNVGSLPLADDTADAKAAGNNAALRAAVGTRPP